MFFGIPISEIDEIAKSCYHGVGVKADDHFLYFLFKSNRGHQTFSSQMSVGPDGKLMPLFGVTHQAELQFLERVSHLHFSKD